MPAPVRILLVGTLIATTTFVGAATSQSLVDSDQVQLGDVFSGQTLDVVDVDDQVTGAASATGNALSGAVENDRLDLVSRQDMRGNARADLRLNAGAVGGATTLVATAVGNTGDAGAYGADLDADVTQSVGATSITAAASVDAPQGRFLGGAGVSSTALANSQAFGLRGGRADLSVTQSSAARTEASIDATVQYVPAPAAFTTAAVSNSVAADGRTGTQTLTAVQRATGAGAQATTRVYAGNAWNLAGTATGTGNTATITNQGGSLDATFDQDNGAQVRSLAVVSAYDFGSGSAQAYGVGNSSMAGNNDVLAVVDNLQVNSGGVEAIADFTGHAGYDGYATATAMGNATTGYACSECAGVLQATNRQINNADVSAGATINVGGSNRAVVATSTAVGNSASFYVTGPGG